MGSSELDDAMFPDVLVDESADYTYHHYNGSTLYDHFSYYSFSSYFWHIDFGFNHQDRKVIYIVAFFFLILLVPFGLLSNVFQLYSIVCFPRIRQDVQHIFIANMTIVNIVFLLPVGILDLVLSGREGFGDPFSVRAGEHIIYMQIFLQIVHTAVNFHLASMITALAFDQYIILVYPIMARKWRTSRNAFIACIILWSVGIFVALANGLIYLPIFERTPDTMMLIADSLIFILLCLVPTILTIAFNMMAWNALRNARTAISTDNTHANNVQRFTQLQEENGRIPGALVRAQDLPNNIAITASFVIFWTLYHVVHLIMAFIWALKRFHHWIYFNNKDEVMIIIADIAVHFNVALNPLFYVICNQKFRQHLYRAAYAFARRNSAYTGHIDETTAGE